MFDAVEFTDAINKARAARAAVDKLRAKTVYIDVCFDGEDRDTLDMLDALDTAVWHAEKVSRKLDKAFANAIAAGLIKQLA